jgi:hypothetical protein
MSALLHAARRAQHVLQHVNAGRRAPSGILFAGDDREAMPISTRVTATTERLLASG